MWGTKTGFLFGFYSGIFALYLRYHAWNTEKQNILFYALCCLYAFSAALVAIDVTFISGLSFQRYVSSVTFRAQPVLFATCDFIAQFILIYRCWIVWSHNIRVVIIPAIFAFGFLFLWITASVIMGLNAAGITLISLVPLNVAGVNTNSPLVLISLTASMTVNAIVTGLIVFKIFQVFHEVRCQRVTASLDATGGRKLRSVMFVIIESGMALFSIQLARLVLSIYPLSTTFASNGLYQVTVDIHEMLNGITPTIILVRVSMGLSFHDEPSLTGTVSSLRFAADDPNSIPETRSISQDGSHVEPDDPILDLANISEERSKDGIDGSRDLDIQPGQVDR